MAERCQGYAEGEALLCGAEDCGGWRRGDTARGLIGWTQFGLRRSRYVRLDRGLAVTSLAWETDSSGCDREMQRINQIKHLDVLRATGIWGKPILFPSSALYDINEEDALDPRCPTPLYLPVESGSAFLSCLRPRSCRQTNPQLACLIPVI